MCPSYVDWWKNRYETFCGTELLEGNAHNLEQTFQHHSRDDVREFDAQDGEQSNCLDADLNSIVTSFLIEIMAIFIIREEAPGELKTKSHQWQVQSDGFCVYRNPHGGQGFAMLCSCVSKSFCGALIQYSTLSRFHIVAKLNIIRSKRVKGCLTVPNILQSTLYLRIIQLLQLWGNRIGLVSQIVESVYDFLRLKGKHAWRSNENTEEWSEKTHCCSGVMTTGESGSVFIGP
ncbi:hypothetical protein B0H14DRAFT_2854517 [Mycena olivaceomarginata]|nr:hypothetical protein B0H14DRAFT_2854517 [Mycena olivaceomarginata]